MPCGCQAAPPAPTPQAPGAPSLPVLTAKSTSRRGQVAPGGQNRPCATSGLGGQVDLNGHHNANPVLSPRAPKSYGLRGAFFLPYAPPKFLGQQRESETRLGGDLRAQDGKKLGWESPSTALSTAGSEGVSTCILSSTAPRLQIKNQLRAGGGCARRMQGKLRALACMMDGGDWQGPGVRWALDGEGAAPWDCRLERWQNNARFIGCCED